MQIHYENELPLALKHNDRTFLLHQFIAHYYTHYTLYLTRPNFFFIHVPILKK